MNLNPLDWTWLGFALVLIIVGTASLTWLISGAAARRAQDRASYWRNRTLRAEQTVTMLRRRLRCYPPRQRLDDTVVMHTPQVLREADQILGDASTQILHAAVTPRARRLYGRMRRHR